jgi:hypothetical protein
MNIFRIYKSTITKSSGYVIKFYFLILLFIQGRAALISGPKRQPISQNIPINNRSITSTSTSASSPSFSNVEHIRSYSLSRTYSDQSPPTTSRRTSVSDTNEKSRRSSK